jgi:Skp family chaperone for outer membrane proteins
MNDDTDWQSVAAALSTQLDAERELRKEAEARYSLMQTMEADALREQLDAERALRETAQSNAELWHEEMMKVDKQLAAERELREREFGHISAIITERDKAVDALMKIREKCANVGYCDGLVLPCDAVVVVIDDALAKVKEGK